MDSLPLTDLTLNPYNSKDVSVEDFQRTKRQIITLGQFKPLIIDATKMIIGGHTRYRVYDEVSRMEVYDIQDYMKSETGQDISEEMAKRIIERSKNPFIMTIEFQNNNGGIVAIINGDQQPKVFQSLEQAVTEYALADNDHSGRYNDDIFQVIDQFNINPLDYAVPVFRLPTLQEIVVRQVELPPLKQKEVRSATCPQCGHAFEL